MTIGACVTHAAIADGLVPDIGSNVLASVANGIAYRAVRNRGTIGGSLCHADPAADWPMVLTALDAIAVAHGPGWRSRHPGSPGLFWARFLNRFGNFRRGADRRAYALACWLTRAVGVTS